MDKIREKLHVPKAHSVSEVRSLSAIVKDSIYFAWPAASFSQDSDNEAKRRLLRQSAAIVDEEDIDF